MGLAGWCRLQWAPRGADPPWPLAPLPPSQLAKHPGHPASWPGPRAHPVVSGGYGRPEGGQSRLGAPRAEGAASTPVPACSASSREGRRRERPGLQRAPPTLCPPDATLVVRQAQPGSPSREMGPRPGAMRPSLPGVSAGSPGPLRPCRRPPAQKHTSGLRPGEDALAELRGQPGASSHPPCHL